MVFNSFQFLAFFIIVYVLYLCLNHRHQNRMLLVASYVFYGSWDWRFLSLLFVSTVLDYVCALLIDHEERPKRRKLYLLISICGNLGMLGFFKYFNFFTDGMVALLGFFGLEVHPLSLNVLLPIGISFYTFQTMSYTIDVYRRRMPAEKNFLDVALFVSYFPQLVAGPIERAQSLLPQVLSERRVTLEKVWHGGALIFWGLFQKIYVADNLAKIVDPVFASADRAGASCYLAGFAFMIQLYCDFAGYSNIAKGLGKMMGFEIMTNFYLPYFTCNVRDFWKRWHISLTSWVRDYVYEPLIASGRTPLRKAMAALVTMTLVGLWHGAAWHFVAFGLYSGIGLVVYAMLRPVLAAMRSVFPGRSVVIYKVVMGLLYFQFLMFGFLLFRAQGTEGAFAMVEGILFRFSWGLAQSEMLLGILLFAGPLLLIEAWQGLTKDLDVLAKAGIWIRIPVYTLLTLLMLLYGVTDEKAFIYFQF